MKQFYLSLLLLLAAVCAKGQTFTGKVTDSDNVPLAYANVVLLSLPDSTFVTGTVSEESGSFTLQVPAEGKPLLIRVSSIGYATTYKPCTQSDLGVIRLAFDSQLLDEVVVKGDLPKTQMKGDAMVTQVQNSTLSKAGTANDVLSKLPGLVDDGDGLKVLGRGAPEYYINGRKVRDASELDQLGSDEIRSVEVVTNPGARYDASVKAVVRIRTVKRQGEGFGFNNRLYGEYNKKPSWLEQFNFNYRKGGFDLFGLLFYSDSYYWKEHHTVQDTYLDKHWMQDAWTKVTSRTHSFIGNLGANYVINENHSLGATYRISHRPYGKDETYVATDVEQDDAFYENSINIGGGGSGYTSHTADFYYDGKIGGWSLDFDGNAIWQSSDGNSLTQEENTDAGGTLTERQVTTMSNTDYTFYAGKLVLEHPLWGGNLTIGGEYGHMNRQMEYRNPEGIIASTMDEIKEGNAAAFAEYARSFGKVYAQVGVRYEYDNFDYTLNGTHMDEQSKVYHNVFPSASLVFPVGKAQVMLQYRSEIKRPNYSMLSSSVSYVNRYTYESGNPFLRPVLTQSVSLGASYKWLTLQAGYQHIKDDFFDTSEPYSDTDPTIALMSKRNGPEYDALFAAASAAPTIGLWSPVLSASLSKQWLKTEAPGGMISLDKPLFMMGWENSFNLPAGFLLNAGIRWMTTGDSQNTHILDHMWTTNASLYKEIWKGRMSFLLQANDIFNTQKMNGVLYTGSVRTMQMFNEPNSRSVSLTVRFKFNATKSKYKGTGAGEAQKDRM